MKYGAMINGSALYEPDLSSYRVKDGVQSLRGLSSAENCRFG
jgi:hypothetical protein